MTQSLADRALQQIEAFDRALIAADHDAIRRLTCADFTIIHPLGQQHAREAWLTWVASQVRYHRIERSRVKTRVRGGVVIVTSSSHSTIAVRDYLNGEPSIHRTVRTEVWVSEADLLLLQHVQLTHESEPQPHP